MIQAPGIHNATEHIIFKNALILFCLRFRSCPPNWPNVWLANANCSRTLGKDSITIVLSYFFQANRQSSRQFYKTILRPQLTLAAE
jgi:hypothetical protein